MAQMYVAFSILLLIHQHAQPSMLNKTLVLLMSTKYEALYFQLDPTSLCCFQADSLLTLFWLIHSL